MASSNHLSEEEEEEIDSEDEFYQDGYHIITKKEEREYFRAVEASEVYFLLIFHWSNSIFFSFFN